MMKRFEIGSDDDALTIDAINTLPEVATPEADEVLRRFDDEYYEVAYEAGYSTYASFTNDEFNEVVYFVKN
jgi:hypothetical protein